MTRKFEDTAKEPNKSSRYTTRATGIEGEVDHAADPMKGNSSNNKEGRAMLQTALELLAGLEINRSLIEINGSTSIDD